MKRDTLIEWRRPINKMSYYPSAERERQLIDSHLEALDSLDRVQSLAEKLRRDADRPGNTAAAVAASFALEIENALKADNQ